MVSQYASSAPYLIGVGNHESGAFGGASSVHAHFERYRRESRRRLPSLGHALTSTLQTSPAARLGSTTAMRRTRAASALRLRPRCSHFRVCVAEARDTLVALFHTSPVHTPCLNAAPASNAAPYYSFAAGPVFLIVMSSEHDFTTGRCDLKGLIA